MGTRRATVVIAAVIIAFAPVSGASKAAGADSSASLTYQTRFRQEAGLRFDSGYLASLSSGLSVDWGLPLTSDEEAELSRRLLIQATLPDLNSAMSLVPSFAGLFIDQSVGGVVNVQFVGSPPAGVMDTIKAIVPPGTGVQLHSVRNSRANLEKAHALLDQRMELMDGLQASVVDDVVANVLQVGLPASAAALKEEISAQFGSLVSFGDPITVANDTCYNRTDCTPWRAGLQIYSGGGSCTGGFMAKNSSYWFWLTAGHCGGPGTVFHHSGVTVGSVYTTNYYSGTAADASAVKLSSSQKNWLYATDSDQAHTITARQGHDGDFVGEFACQAGNVSGNQCGTITNTNFSGTDDYGKWNVRQREASFCVLPGDSGAPVYGGGVSHLALGILKGHASSSCDAIYGHIWEVEQGLADGIVVYTGP